MPKHDELVPAEMATFYAMRVAAILKPPTDPIHQEVRDAGWASFGAAVYANLHNERFRAAIRKALDAADAQHQDVDPLDTLVNHIRLYLLMGTIP